LVIVYALMIVKQIFIGSQKQQDLSNLVGAMYVVVMILGTINVMEVQPVVAMEQIVLYRQRAARMYSELAYAFGQV
jgi:hypothetical protein